MLVPKNRVECAENFSWKKDFLIVLSWLQSWMNPPEHWENPGRPGQFGGCGTTRKIFGCVFHPFESKFSQI